MYLAADQERELRARRIAHYLTFGVRPIVCAINNESLAVTDMYARTPEEVWQLELALESARDLPPDQAEGDGGDNNGNEVPFWVLAAEQYTLREFLEAGADTEAATPPNPTAVGEEEAEGRGIGGTESAESNAENSSGAAGVGADSAAAAMDAGGDDGSGLTPLFFAIYGDNLAAARLLLDNGAQVAVVASDGTTPLIVAAQLPNAVPFLKLILGECDATAAGAAEVVADHTSTTPFKEDSAKPNTSAQDGRIFNRRLLDYNVGCLINQRDKASGFTALHWAVMMGNAEACELLVRAGARTDIRNHSGKSPLNMARGLVRRVLNESRVDSECWRNRYL